MVSVIGIIILLVLGFFGRQVGMVLREQPIYLVKPSPQKFGKDALILMDELGIYSEENDFKSNIPKFISEMERASTYEEVLPVLNKAIKIAGGKHSQMLHLDSAGKTDDKEASHLVVYPSIKVEEQIMIIYLPPFTKGSKEQKECYINTSLEAINKHTKIKGVIVDLRGNTGGDMVPMLGALSPLIKDGPLFRFITKKKKWS